jgi:hypothetical protein
MTRTKSAQTLERTSEGADTRAKSALLRVPIPRGTNNLLVSCIL